jgi:myo-inositol-1(or 4)-monophosphatase
LWRSSDISSGVARAVRRLGSAALDLSYVAAGRFEAFWEQHLKPWDVAGGRFESLRRREGRSPEWTVVQFDPAAAHLIASNGQVHAEVVDTIRAFRAERAKTQLN